MDYGLLKVFVFSGPILLFVVWQLVSVSRELRDTDERDDTR